MDNWEFGDGSSAPRNGLESSEMQLFKNTRYYSLAREICQEEILPSLFVYTNYSRSTIFDWIRDLFNRYQLDITLFSLLFIEKE